MYKALLVAALSGCVVIIPGSDAGAAQLTANALPATHTVHVKNFKFEPASVTIHAGDRVSFINDDDEAHTVTATDKSFDSEGLDGGQTWQHVFSKPGTYSYYCEMHPYMKAEIIVLADAGARQIVSSASNPFANRPAESLTFTGHEHSPAGSRNAL